MDRFAELGYQGLRWAETVARYRKTWQNAINAGHAKKVRPGDKVDLPDLVWSEWYDSTDGHPRYRNEHADELRAEAARQGVGPSKVIDVAQNLGALGVAIAADPKAADKAMAALRSSGRLREAVDTDPEVAAEVAASDSVRRKVDENYRKMAERGRAGSHPVEPKPAHVRDGRLIDALDHILRAAMHTRSAVNDLEGVTLTEDERRRFTAEHEQLANWVEGLRARIAGGDLDDELRALLEAEK